MCRYARIGWVLTVAAVLAFGAQPAAASKGKHKPKPDLYVRGAEFGDEDEHALRGEDNVLRFAAETQNRGRGAAKPSKTEIVFYPLESNGDYADGKPIHAFSLNVSRIRGYTDVYLSDTGAVKSPPLTFNGDPLGTYEAVWCADAENKVKESNERNNCRVPGGVLQRLSLSKRTWTGTVSGTGAVGQAPTSAHEDWSSTGASLELERVSGSIFYYYFKGTMSWVMGGGTDSHGCSYTGSGTDSVDGGPASGELQLDYADGSYGVNFFYSDLDYTYPVSVQCPTSTESELGPFFGGFLNTFYDGRVRPLPFGTEVLAGSGYDEIDRATYTWEFR